ncbi:MAG: type II toxin-antitoxin system VapC family toxin [Candidatus Bipolaricaulota bacterium]|nr:type II toxin-antitoxin system VapC family toxin [Candidatus Bipolaricaulota bacterium]MDW8031511.1 type II toxin-antitoxin system VapC family toxin [Candidatus Bipolaricaulota bacterium]
MAWKVARTSDCSFYDALYVALAQQQDALFITADEKLVSALCRGQLRKRVRWLGAWKGRKH